ncbi:unnamed protein product [Symbiodinium sp. CCMP2456]|nr:unnamed protein product [Symbiodinium sp. CCMP2456]
MYHERVLLWFVDGLTWLVLTPDFDMYVEDVFGHDDAGCDYLKMWNADFQYWSRVGEAAYRFSRDISDEELNRKIAESIEAFGETVRKTGAWRPTGIFLRDGSTQDATSFLGTPWQGDSFGAKVRPTETPSMRVDMLAMPGESEPLGNLVLVQEVSLNMVTDVQVGDRLVFFSRGGERVKAELVRTEDSEDYALRRRALFKYPTSPASEGPAGTRLLDQIEQPTKKGAVDEKCEEARTLWEGYDESMMSREKDKRRGRTFVKKATPPSLMRREKMGCSQRYMF